MSDGDCNARDETELNHWHSLYGADPECKAALRGIKDGFSEFFPDGHETCIKDWVEDAIQLAESDEGLVEPFHLLDNVHQEAWPLLLKYGQNFKPIPWDKLKPWEWDEQPTPGYCFRNSIDFLINNGLTAEDAGSYVEGLCLGPLVKPILHAWIRYAATDRSLDWTFYSYSDFNRYYGVPFTCAEYDYINQKSDGGIACRMLFRNDCFPAIRSRVLEVLEGREVCA